jgi:hypothetical protein
MSPRDEEEQHEAVVDALARLAGFFTYPLLIKSHAKVKKERTEHEKQNNDTNC